MGYHAWNLPPSHPGARRRLEQSGIPSLVAAVLSARGIESYGQAQGLLSGELPPLEDPMELKDMDRAVDRIQTALVQGQRMAVYGDYDVDGITATCLLTHALTCLGGDVLPYIPDRMEEGYGLNGEAISALAQQGVSLIVTVDCGITATQEVAHAASLGVDVIITDHHACKAALPLAVAVIDPHRPDCSYPFKGLAGVGVALKVAMAVAGDGRAQEMFGQYADLAAIGTVADVMPMTGENRTIVQAGLAALSQGSRLGLAKLVEMAGLTDRPLTSVSVGYTLAPRINAAGRMGRANVAAQLLLSQQLEEATQLAQLLCELNRSRQRVEGEIFQTCIQRLEQEPQQGIILLADQGWHQGVMGIVASRLAERYACPTFMVCLDHGMGKGSCRSWGGINLFQLLGQCEDLLESFGGHTLAAGFTIREEKLEELVQRLRSCVQCQGESEELPAILETDGLIQPQELTVAQVEQLALLEPCGTGNPRPVLVLMGVCVTSTAQVGRGRHLKLRLESQGLELDGIFFSADGAQLGLFPGCRIDLAFSPQINEFRGVRSVQLQIIDLQHTRHRMEQEQQMYQRYQQRGVLAPYEARMLLPHRELFVGLWRYFMRCCAPAQKREETLSHLVQEMAQLAGMSEPSLRLLISLEVLSERGLIELEHQGERLGITLCVPEGKVDLEASSILQFLRACLGE